MTQALCPIVVGRAEELRILQETLRRVGERRGGVLFITGEPGIGKSRLTREAEAQAEARGMPALRGRATQADQPVPYRAFTEALGSAFREGGPPSTTELEPFRGALGRIVPEWRQSSPALEESPVVILEGMVRLLGVLAEDAGLLLVLEDLHWADADTVSVVEYLADNLGSEPVLAVCTARSEPPSPALDLAETLAARRTIKHLALGRLGDGDVDEMIRATLQSELVSAPVVDAVRSRAEGVPFFVEEMLSAYLTAGASSARPDEPASPSGLASALPPSYRELVHERLASLPVGGRPVLTAAAVLGRSFDWSLLAVVIGLREEEVLGALRSAVAANLIAPARFQDRVSFAFRHALARDATLAELLPPERTELSRRAANAIGAVHPELFGDWCEIVAELREQAGERLQAARLLLESGQRALVRGALATAEATLDRARQLALGDEVLLIGIDHARLDVLGQAGKTDRILEVGEALLRSRGGSAVAGRDGYWEPAEARAKVKTRWSAPAYRIAELHLQVARGASGTTRPGAVREHLDLADRLAGESGHQSLLARISAFRATRALAEGRTDEAARIASEALALGLELRLTDVICEALHVQGQLAVIGGELDQAERVLADSRTIAERDGLIPWMLRSLLELGTLARWSGTPPIPLEEGRDLARRSGAVATQAALELQLAIRQLDKADLEAAASPLSSCLDLSRQYQLPLLADGLIAEATRHALGAEEPSMEAAITEALEVTDNDPRIDAQAWGQARAILSIVQERSDRLRRTLERAGELAAGLPQDPGWGFHGLLGLLRAIDGSDETAPDDDGGRSGVMVGLDSAYIACARGVILGRGGARDEAERAFREGLEGLPPGWRRHHVARAVAPAALLDGWGEPASWLKEAAAFFEAHGMPKPLAATRGLLRRAGVRLPRRGRGESAVPPELGSLGITSREVDVLRFVAEGLSNAEIADRLYLSPRTIETHVASLMRKAQVGSRSELVAFAARSPAQRTHP